MGCLDAPVPPPALLLCCSTAPLTSPPALPAAEGDAAAAQAALDAMPGDGVAAGRAHHNALLAAYAAAGDLQGADAAYGRMQAAGFPGDAVTFRALLGSVRQWAALESEWLGPWGGLREATALKQLGPGSCTLPVPHPSLTAAGPASCISHRSRGAGGQ